MNATPLCTDYFDGDIFEKIATDIAETGHCILHNALPASITEALFLHVQSMNPARFQQAGIGRDTQHHLNQFVRKDEIRWLDHYSAADKSYLDWMESLRISLNRRLFLGLFDYEAHFAHYGPGAFYKRHLDAFKGNTNRVLTTVFYLNPGWLTQEGGELVIYEENSQVILHKVLPIYGTLVVFLSENFPHEVLVTQRDRYSIAGWFRVNNTLGMQIDPPR